MTLTVPQLPLTSTPPSQLIHNERGAFRFSATAPTVVGDGGEAAVTRQPAVPEWSEHDSAIWHTCEIASRLIAGSVGERPPIACPFPPQIAGDEQLLVQGGFDLFTHRAAGDGSYNHDGGMYVATGRGGLAMTAGVAAARASANRRRRNVAAAATTPRWVLDDRGCLWVSTAGFYLQTAGGLFPWPWGSVQSAMLTGPATVHVQGSSEAGPVSWTLQSHWSELLFVLWAITVHNQHPSLPNGGWLPPGWRERCAAAGYGFQPSTMTEIRPRT